MTFDKTSLRRLRHPHLQPSGQLPLSSAYVDPDGNHIVVVEEPPTS
jgi:hypothetical protein